MGYIYNFFQQIYMENYTSSIKYVGSLTSLRLRQDWLSQEVAGNIDEMPPYGQKIISSNTLVIVFWSRRVMDWGRHFGVKGRILLP